MQVGDLVRMHARSVEPVYGVGIIVRDLRIGLEGHPRLGVQVYWSKFGLGNRVNVHSLERISEFQEG